MQALIFDGDLHVDDVPAPVPAPDEALIKVSVAGICGTDLEITRGYKGFRGIPGHEFVGRVVEAPEGTAVGARVCGEINIGCGTCALCQDGLQNHCTDRRVLGLMGRDGAFAEFLTLPLHNLHRVPDGLTDDEAVFVEPLAAAFQVLEQVAIRPGDRVVVIGDGRLGLLCAQVIAGTGAEVTLEGRHPERLAQAQLWGVQTRTAGEETSPADVVVDATGSPTGTQRALGMVRPRGTVVLKSTTAGADAIDLTPAVVKEVTLVGSRCGPFPRAIDALASREIDVRPLVTDRFRLDQGVQAFARAAESTAIKVLLDMP